MAQCEKDSAIVEIGDGTDNTFFFCPKGTSRGASGCGPIDWDCDGNTTGVDVSSDVNRDTLRNVLSGFDDWANLQLDFQKTGSFEDGDHSASQRVTEIDVPSYLQTYAVSRQSVGAHQLGPWP